MVFRYVEMRINLAQLGGNKTYEKENHLHTYTGSRCDRLLFVGRNTADHIKPETHVERMEYALENISYWELADDGETVILYDFEGNIYNW